MAQLFHHGANNVAKASLVAAILLGGVAFYVYTQVARSSYLTNRYLERQQPVQFSHKHHVGDDGIDCRYCHT
ncbi:MAG: cytochrome c family protein, partial [Acidobacteriota bacterium]|nr:cytochrome c family protein [Acidobacteriota bacterium]